MKDKRSGLSVLLPTAGMEICRLYIIVSLVHLIPEGPHYSITAMACILTMGVLAGRFLSFVTMRRIFIVFFYSVSCAPCVYFFAFSHSGSAFWVGVCAAVFFFSRGIFLGTKGVSHGLTVKRYDIGILVFFGVYFFRMGIGHSDLLALRVVGAYFLFSILAMAASRSWERDKYFVGSRPAISFVVLFIAVFILAAAAIVLLYPLLAQAATGMYVVLREVSVPVLAFITAILRFLFSFGYPVRSGPADSAPEESMAIIPKEAVEPGLFMKILSGILFTACAVMVLIVVVLLIRALIQYLYEKKGPNEGKGFFTTLKMLLRLVWDSLRSALRTVRRIITVLLRPRNLAGAAEESFRRLCVWGRASGLPRRKSETPSEYVFRIGTRFPDLRETVSVFASALEEELYAGRPPDGKVHSLLKTAQKNLKNPSLFFGRFLCFMGLRRSK